MFGYFGKGYIAPAPGAPPETAAAKAAADADQGVVQQIEAEDEDLPAVRGPFPGKAPAGAPPTVIQSRLAQLRAEIEARRQAKQAKLAALHATQAKQAAYGRGETSSGKRSESEVAIGVSTGYYNGYGNYKRFGDLTKEIADSSEEVRKATELVKALTEDIKTGSATRSELQKAMRNLAIKAKKAKALAQKAEGLEGYGEEKKSFWSFAPLVAVGILIFFLMPRG